MSSITENTLAEPAVTPEAGAETADGGITSNKRSVGNTSFDQSPRTSNSKTRNVRLLICRQLLVQFLTAPQSHTVCS